MLSILLLQNTTIIITTSCYEDSSRQSHSSLGPTFPGNRFFQTTPYFFLIFVNFFQENTPVIGKWFIAVSLLIIVKSYSELSIIIPIISPYYSLFLVYLIRYCTKIFSCSCSCSCWPYNPNTPHILYDW